MAKRKRKKIEVKSKYFSGFELPESYTSLILGAIVVLIAGILFAIFAIGNRNAQTSSTKDSSKTEKQNSSTSSTYTINPGDDLWSISKNFYNDGYKWVEIAKANNLKNPGLIHPGNQLFIPSVVPAVAQKFEQITQNQNFAVQNNSITGNTYTVKSGDNLWDISVRAYGDGFKWPDIARVNNLENPDLIHIDNLLKIPR